MSNPISTMLNWQYLFILKFSFGDNDIFNATFIPKSFLVLGVKFIQILTLFFG